MESRPDIQLNLQEKAQLSLIEDKVIHYSEPILAGLIEYSTRNITEEGIQLVGTVGDLFKCNAPIVSVSSSFSEGKFNHQVDVKTRDGKELISLKESCSGMFDFAGQNQKCITSPFYDISQKTNGLTNSFKISSAPEDYLVIEDDKGKAILLNEYSEGQNFELYEYTDNVKELIFAKYYDAYLIDGVLQQDFFNSPMRNPMCKIFGSRKMTREKFIAIKEKSPEDLPHVLGSLKYKSAEMKETIRNCVLPLHHVVERIEDGSKRNLFKELTERGLQLAKELEEEKPDVERIIPLLPAAHKRGEYLETISNVFWELLGEEENRKVLTERLKDRVEKAKQFKGQLKVIEEGDFKRKLVTQLGLQYCGRFVLKSIYEYAVLKKYPTCLIVPLDQNIPKWKLSEDSRYFFAFGDNLVTDIATNGISLLVTSTDGKSSQHELFNFEKKEDEDRSMAIENIVRHGDSALIIHIEEAIHDEEGGYNLSTLYSVDLSLLKTGQLLVAKKFFEFPKQERVQISSNGKIVFGYSQNRVEGKSYITFIDAQNPSESSERKEFISFLQQAQLVEADKSPQDFLISMQNIHLTDSRVILSFVLSDRGECYGIGPRGTLRMASLHWSAGTEIRLLASTPVTSLSDDCYLKLCWLRVNSNPTLFALTIDGRVVVGSLIEDLYTPLFEHADFKSLHSFLAHFEGSSEYYSSPYSDIVYFNCMGEKDNDRLAIGNVVKGIRVETKQK